MLLLLDSLLQEMIILFTIALLGPLSLVQGVQQCLYCTSDPDGAFHDYDCAVGSPNINRHQCTLPYTAGCVVFTLTGETGTHTYRDCCHQGTGETGTHTYRDCC